MCVCLSLNYAVHCTLNMYACVCIVCIVVCALRCSVSRTRHTLFMSSVRTTSYVIVITSRLAMAAVLRHIATVTCVCAAYTVRTVISEREVIDRNVAAAAAAWVRGVYFVWHHTYDATGGTWDMFPVMLNCPLLPQHLFDLLVPPTYTPSFQLRHTDAAAVYATYCSHFLKAFYRLYIGF